MLKILFVILWLWFVWLVGLFLWPLTLELFPIRQRLRDRHRWYCHHFGDRTHFWHRMHGWHKSRGSSLRDMGIHRSRHPKPFLNSKIMITFNCWSNYSNKHINWHANYPLLWCCTPLVWERTSPPFGGAWGRLSLCYFVLLAPNHIFTYISVIQIVTMVFAELVTPVSRKTIVFRIKLLTFANREQKSANNNQPTPTSTAPPDLPEQGGVQIARLPQEV